MAIEIVDLPMKNCDFSLQNVSLPEGINPFPDPHSFFRKKLRLLIPKPRLLSQKNKSQGTPNYDGDDESGQPITREYMYIICMYVCIYIYVYIYIYMCICIYLYMYMYVSIFGYSLS